MLVLLRNRMLELLRSMLVLELHKELELHMVQVLHMELELHKELEHRSMLELARSTCCCEA
jgi:hypothetical protein